MGPKAELILVCAEELRNVEEEVYVIVMILSWAHTALFACLQTTEVYSMFDSPKSAPTELADGT